jgi:hypothetical protein
MPSVLRVEGFNFVMFFNDHSPAHVHAVRAGAWVVILIDGAEPVVRDVHEMKQNDVARALDCRGEPRTAENRVEENPWSRI